jgi:hypothetical protein
MVNYNITPLSMREENAKLEKGTSKRDFRKKPYILMEKGFSARMLLLSGWQSRSTRVTILNVHRLTYCGNCESTKDANILQTYT